MEEVTDPSGHGGPLGLEVKVAASLARMKFVLLELLQERPMHGTSIKALRKNRWFYTPSPGSIYPTLQMLEDGGMVTSAGLRKKYTITDAGRLTSGASGSQGLAGHLDALAGSWWAWSQARNASVEAKWRRQTFGNCG
jgi:DNA-binding PadR family transcriptional regulator